MLVATPTRSPSLNVAVLLLLSACSSADAPGMVAGSGGDAGEGSAGRSAQDADAPVPMDGSSGAPDTPLQVDAGASSDAAGVDASASSDAAVQDAATPDANLSVDGGMEDAGPLDAGDTRDAGPPGPPDSGTYLYTRVPAATLQEAVSVAFHPDGTYALVVERVGGVHVYDWADGSATRFDLTSSGVPLTLTDIAFSPDGGFALVTGYESDTSDTGILVRFDDAVWRGGGGAGTFARLAQTGANERFTAVGFAPPGYGPAADGHALVLAYDVPSPPSTALLRELDSSTGTFSGVSANYATTVGCEDFAFVDNEFGDWGIVLVCGFQGGDAPYYTSVAGVTTWRAGPVATLGNTSRVSGHPSGAYALAVSWSGRRVHRFEAGAWANATAAPYYPTKGLWDVSFAPDGRRGLIVGRAALPAPLQGTVIEYRHDLYSAPAMSDVSIEAFDSAPYFAESDTYLQDSAFRPGCDGGLIVGGKAGSTGLLITFQITNATTCP